MNKQKKYISNILHIEADKLKNEHISYFYTKFPEWCCNVTDPPLFEGIKEFDFLTPIEKLATYYDNTENSYYTELLKRLKKQKSLSKPNTISNFNNQDIDQMLIQYIACRPNIQILTTYPDTKNTDIKKLISNDYHIYATKNLKISTNLLSNLIFLLNAKTKEYSDIASIKKFSNTFKSPEITVFVLEKKNNTTSKLSSSNTQYHLTTDFAQSKELSQVFFNENSWKFLELQSLERFISFHMRACRIIVNTFKNFIYQEIHPLDRLRFLVLSGSLLYSYGLRPCSDIDGFIQNYPKTNIVTDDFIKKVNHYLLNPDTKFPIVDFYMKDNPISTWKDFWDDWHKEWTGHIGAKNFSEITHDPSKHFYYLGLKFIILDAEMYRRFKRARVRSYADIIATNEILGTKYKLPPIPEIFMLKDEDIKIDNVKQLDEIINSISKALFYRFRIKKSSQEIIELIPNYNKFYKKISQQSLPNKIKIKPKSILPKSTITPIDKPSTKKTIDKPLDKPSTKKIIDKAVDKPLDKPSTKKTIDKPLDKPVDKPSTKKIIDKPVDKPVDKPSTKKIIDKPVDKEVDKAVDKPVKKIIDKPVDKEVDKAVDKPVKKIIRIKVIR
jgi:hypothetical protein